MLNPSLSRLLAVFLLAPLSLLGQETRSRPAAGEEPVFVIAGQAQIRSLEKWRPGQAVLESVPQPKTARLIFQPAETMTEPIQKGQAARVKLPPPREGYVSGVVDRVTNQADLHTGAARVELLVENPGNALVQGRTYSAEVQVVKRPNALVVPRAAFFSEGSQTFVFRLNRPSGKAKVEKVAVPLGYATEEWVEVSTGLWPGQWLATSNLNRLQDGATVFAQGGSR